MYLQSWQLGWESSDGWSGHPKWLLIHMSDTSEPGFPAEKSGMLFSFLFFFLTALLGYSLHIIKTIHFK